MKLLLLFLIGYGSMLLRGFFTTPFYFLLLYLWITLLYPQGFLPPIVADLPLGLVSIICAALAVPFVSKTLPRFTPTYGLIVLFSIWVSCTTMWAAVPEAAGAKWAWVIKSLALPLLMPFFARTRAQIEALVLIIFLGLIPHVLTAGIKSVLGGGGYGVLRLLITRNYFLGETSTLATVAIAIVPLGYYLLNNSLISDRFPFKRPVFWGYCALSLAAMVGTSARSGLIAFVASLMVAVPGLIRKLLVLLLVALLGTAATSFLPDFWTKRMSTISEYETESSASTRLRVWQWTADYATRNPLGGGFDVYRINGIGDEGIGRAFHSAYFEILGEQGFVGFLLYALIWTIIMWRLFRMGGGSQIISNDLLWLRVLSKTLFVSLTALLVGALFIGIGYQPFMTCFMGLYLAILQLDLSSPTSVNSPQEYPVAVLPQVR